MAFELAARGYALGLASRRIARLEELRDALHAKHPGLKVELATLDVDQVDTVKGCLDDLFTRMGGADIVVVNAEKIRVTGNKLKDKIYYRHTGYIGNLKSISLEKQLEKRPERVIQAAVKGMLPRNPLGRAMFKKLHVYAGPDHPHAAQQPTALDL